MTERESIAGPQVLSLLDSRSGLRGGRPLVTAHGAEHKMCTPFRVHYTAANVHNVTIKYKMLGPQQDNQSLGG